MKPNYNRLVALLRSHALPRVGRGAVFAKLLRTTGGPWARGARDDSTFAEFVYAQAKREVNRNRHRASEASLDTADVYQSILMRLLDAAPKITVPIEQWVPAAARFEVRRALRDARIFRGARSLQEDQSHGIQYPEPPAPEQWTPAQIQVAKIVEVRVYHAIDRLTPALRAVAEIRLLTDPGMTLVAVARHLDINSDCARQRWRRARLALQAYLVDIDVTLFMTERRLTST